MGSDLWTPLAFDEDERIDRVSHYLTTFALLKPDVTFEQADAEMGTLYERQRTEHEGDGRDRRMVVRWFKDGMVDIGLVPIMGLWQAAAFLVLLIACANVANLLLARGAARQRELAVRLAIGASRWRLVRSLLTESVVLAVAATPVALLVAALTLGGLRSAMPGELVRYVAGWEQMGVDLRLALITLAAAGVTAMVFGLLPALQASRPAPAETLKEGGRALGTGHARSRLRRGLVVAEVALALPLLVATGMSAVGAQRFSSGPQGYEPDGLLQLRMQLPTSDYPDAASQRLFAERIVEAAAAVTGVDEAASTSVLPSSTSNTRRSLEVEGQPLEPGTAPPLINTRSVSPGYLELLRVPVLEGRSIEARDRDGVEPVAVVSRSMAQRYWPEESAIGQRIRLGTDPTDWITIVGVVGDTIDDWFISRNVPTVYAPVHQFPTTLVNLALRTSGDPAALVVGARQAIASVDPTLAPLAVSTLHEAIRIRTTGLRFVGGIMGAFGGIALVLATLGIYGVMAFFVAQRRHEIGIRMALGASARDVLVRTATRGGRMAALGIAIGLVLGVLLARLMESALFGTVAIEPWLFAVIAGVLATVALAASIIPARQAARVDPVVALRTE
jgi:predicted permease